MWPGRTWIGAGLMRLLVLAACGRSSAARDEQAWRLAEKAYQESGDRSAHRLWEGLNPTVRHLQDQQGVLILAELRAAGFGQRAVFIHEFLPRRMENLRRLYGPIVALPTFDSAAVMRALEGAD